LCEWCGPIAPDWKVCAPQSAVLFEFMVQ